MVCNSALAGLDFVHMRTSRQIGKSRVRECLKEGVTRVNLKCWWSSGLFGSVSSRQSSEGGGSNQTHDLDSRDQTRPPFSSVHLHATSKSPQNTSKSSWSRDSKSLSILQPRSKIANRTNQSTSGCPRCGHQAHFTFSYLGPLTGLAFGVPTAMMANAPTPSP